MEEKKCEVCGATRMQDKKGVPCGICHGTGNLSPDELLSLKSSALFQQQQGSTCRHCNGWKSCPAFD